MTHRVTLHIAGTIDIDREINGETKVQKVTLSHAFRKVLTAMEGISHRWGSAPKGALERRLEKLVLA